jgi:L-seryl-tRNA selenium transferase
MVAIVDARRRVPRTDVVLANAAAAALRPTATTLTRVINATGVGMHTNLGRAPLPEAARHAVLAAAGWTDVEFDVASGQHSRRGAGALDALPSAALSRPEGFAHDLQPGPPVRRGDMPAVVGRIEGGRLLLDLRAVAPADDERLGEAVLAVATGGGAPPTDARHGPDRASRTPAAGPR